MPHIDGHCKLLTQRGCRQRLTVYAISERIWSVQRHRALHLPSELQETKKISLSITGNSVWKFRPTLQYSVEILVIKNDSKVHYITLSWNEHLCGALYLVWLSYPSASSKCASYPQWQKRKYVTSYQNWQFNPNNNSFGSLNSYEAVRLTVGPWTIEIASERSSAQAWAL